MKLRLLLSLFFLFYSWASLHAEIRVIPEREYFDIVHGELGKAKESIEVTMFLIKLGDDSPKVKSLLDDLIEARKRGVKVEVTLEDKRDNEKAYEYLKGKISIQFDSPEIKTHCKKIFIDGRKLIIGSSNWTESAFGKNHESNVIVDFIEDRDKILLLEGEDYFNNLMRVFKDCRESLDIVMYLFLFRKGDFDDPINHIIDEIVRLHKKGVKIRLLLDSWEEDPFTQHEAVKNLLGLEGISVYYDRGSIATHNKLIIADGEKVLLGSTNWTESAIEKNVESSILIDGVEIARVFSDYFDLLLEEIPKTDLNVQYFPLPVDFIKEGSPLDWLKDRALVYSVKLYLWLIWKSFQDKSPEIAIQKEQWYDIVYSGKGRQPCYKRARIDNCLKHLKHLNLIRVKGERLILLNPEKPDLEWEFPREDYFSVPGKFMEYQWFNKISVKAIFGYFINLAEFKKSSSKPYWFDSLPRLGKRYGLRQRAVHGAFQELMRFNLIEIIHDIPDPGQAFWERKANRYLINPLYSEAEIEARWKRLEKRHGELYLKARELAASIKEPEDPDITASIIMLMKIYGEEAATEAIAKARRYSFGSGRWEMRYIVGILKNDYKPIKDKKTKTLFNMTSK